MLTQLVQKCMTRPTFHMFSFRKCFVTLCWRLRLLFIQNFSFHTRIESPQLFLLNHYFQKKDTLGKKHKKSRVVKRLTRKEWISWPLKSRDEYLESVCHLLPFWEWLINCQPFSKMLWRGLGMAWSTGKQVIITSPCKGEKKTNYVSWHENLVLVFPKKEAN